jgi:hypothetical protein
VHLQHGLLGASSDWALNGPGFSLVFLLADAGRCKVQGHALCFGACAFMRGLLCVRVCCVCLCECMCVHVRMRVCACT